MAFLANGHLTSPMPCCDSSFESYRKQFGLAFSYAVFELTTRPCLLQLSKYFEMAFCLLLCPHKHGFGVSALLLAAAVKCLASIDFGKMLSLRFKTKPKFEAVKQSCLSSNHKLLSDCFRVLHSISSTCSFILNSC